jgi:hypothetical protein
MADEEAGKTGKQALAEQYFKLGFELQFDEDKMKKNLDPVMASLNKKLEGLTKASKLEQGIFGKDFFTEKIKGLTGFDNRLVVGIQNIIKFGAASKTGAIDNGEFYNSLNFMGKGLASLAAGFRKKKRAEKEAAEQSRETQNDIVSLDDAIGRMEGFDRAGATTDTLAANLESLGPATQEVAGGLTKVVAGEEAATLGAETFAGVATLGLALVAVALIKIAEGFYQAFMQVVAARDEFKKFDRMMGGVGSAGIISGIATLGELNTELWGLGQSLETVNNVVYDFMQAGLNFKQSADKNLVGTVIQLASVAGVANSEVAKLYGTLLKTTAITMGSIEEAGNTFVKFNQSVSKFSNLGQISFAQFSESINSSANALSIAASKGEGFTSKMIKDLTSLTALAVKLDTTVGSWNAKFEAAGSLVSNADDKFRTLLILSGGANFSQMMTNQFDKTEAMIKNVEYAQRLNKSFGGNAQLTAQIMQQSMGVTKEEAIKMINMNKSALEELRIAAKQISDLQTGAQKDAWEKVNSDLSSKWNMIKTMFVTFFQNVFGKNQGMQTFLKTLENIMDRLKKFMEEGNKEGGWVRSLDTILTSFLNWAGTGLTRLVNWLDEMFKKYETGGNPLSDLWDTMLDKLADAAQDVGLRIVKGVMMGLLRIQAFFMTGGMSEMVKWIYESTKYGSSPNAMSQQIDSPLNKQLSKNRDRESEIAKQQSGLDKYKPDAITYGVNANGQTGFMTIDQKRFALQEEEKRLKEEDVALQKQMAGDIHVIAQAVTTKNSNGQVRTSSPSNDNPLMSGLKVAGRVGLGVATFGASEAARF